MRIVTKTEFDQSFAEFTELIEKGAVFIYPTDTIYGIGCNAEDEQAVNKIRVIKERPTNPFSVMAPSKDWITDNFESNAHVAEWTGKLPGPYTLILQPKEQPVASNITQDKPTVGVRIPDHWCAHMAKKLKLPIVSTSANKQGEAYMTSLEDLDDEIKQSVDFIIYEGEKNGKPSTIVNLSEDQVEVISR